MANIWGHWSTRQGKIGLPSGRVHVFHYLGVKSAILYNMGKLSFFFYIHIGLTMQLNIIVPIYFHAN